MNSVTSAYDLLSSNLWFNLTNYENDNINGLLIDFTNIVQGKSQMSLAMQSITSSVNWVPQTYSEGLPKKENLIIKCSLPSLFILDIFYLIISERRTHTVLLMIESISEEGLRFVKQLGVQDVIDQDAKTKTNSMSHVTNPYFNQIIKLTTTEIGVLYLISKGFTNHQLANFLSRSYHTVKNHKINIVRKIGLNHCSELVELTNAMKFHLVL
ncbi:helix-turn-helix transcriptional regulator [Fulvivirgaceae bacterium PWU4]|uniref:Helix-turn-helix transcriptional regulator n=1 Tax=Chryseosolibacter histidini TaxID=2782349 RepID=A0AAP2DMK3_9BACT|nr:helix-turn-helix transcriptional regulator [Chryseosolibacter histidini]MBT1699136.1 helix-turn-helix transcriptional regulator [Chryseosolibacter histidini]